MWETVWEILHHSLIDSLKTLPFLFLAYLLIEFLEHHTSGKMEKALAGSGKLGVIFGALLGCVPQFMKKMEHSFVLRLFVQPLCIYKHSPAGSVKCSLCCFVSGRHLKGQIQIQPMLPAIRVEILFISSHSLVTGSQFL